MINARKLQCKQVCKWMSITSSAMQIHLCCNYKKDIMYACAHMSMYKYMYMYM